MPRSSFFRTLSVFGVGMACAMATAQVSTLAWTTDDDDPFGFFSTDAGVGVNAHGVVSTGNMRASLFARSDGSPLSTFQVGDDRTRWNATSATCGSSRACSTAVTRI